MQARIDHQPHRAPHLVGELPEAVVRIFVQAHVVAQLLGIQGPTLTIRDEVRGLAEHRRIGQLECARELEVVTRHRLVQRERHHFPGRPRFGFVQVDVVIARAGAVGGTGLIVRSGGVGRRGGRNLAHAVGLARNVPEDTHQLRVDPFCRRPVSVQQLVRGLVEKFRVIPQVGEKLGQRALEPQFGLELLHRAVQARNFLQTRFVDLVHVQVGGRLEANQEAVVGLAIGQVAGGDRRTRPWQVLVLQVGLQLAERRYEPVADGRPGVGLQRTPIGFGDAVGELQERTIEGAAGRVIDHLLRDLRRYALHQHARRRVGSLGSLLHQRDRLIDMVGKRRHAGEVFAVIGGDPERHHLDNGVVELRSVLVIDRPQILTKPLPLNGALQEPFEGVVVQLLIRRQRGPIDRMQALQGGPIGCFARGDCRRAQIGPAVAVARVSESARAFRVLAQAAFPLVREKAVQGPGGRRGAGRRAGCHLSLQRHRTGAGQQDCQKDNATKHMRLLPAGGRKRGRG